MGGRLSLINVDSSLIASSGISIKEDGLPQAVNRVESNTSLRLLDGEIYGFVEYPFPSPPFKKRLEKTIYRFDGIRRDIPGIAVNFEKIETPEGISIHGDADEEDYIAANLEFHKSKLIVQNNLELTTRLPAFNDGYQKALSHIENLDGDGGIIDQFLIEVQNWSIPQ